MPASASSGTKSKIQEKQNEDKEKFDTIVKLYLDAVKKEQKKRLIRRLLQNWKCVLEQ